MCRHSDSWFLSRRVADTFHTTNIGEQVYERGGKRLACSEDIDCATNADNQTPAIAEVVIAGEIRQILIQDRHHHTTEFEYRYSHQWELVTATRTEGQFPFLYQQSLESQLLPCAVPLYMSQELRVRNDTILNADKTESLGICKRKAIEFSTCAKSDLAAEVYGPVPKISLSGSCHSGHSVGFACLRRRKSKCPVAFYYLALGSLS
jgi:hypothetical protein